jgi:hypothetical protein
MIRPHRSTLKRERESRVHGSPSTSRILFPFSYRLNFLQGPSLRSETIAMEAR